MSISDKSQHICNYLRGKNWHTYNYLDTRLNELSRYISFAPENRDTWSEALADLLILTGSAIDSFFRDMGECPNIRSSQHYIRVQQRVRRRRRPEWNINDFRDAYEPIYELSKNEVDVPFGLSYYGTIQPFIEFDTSSDRISDWWNGYNHLKHNYYDSLIEANLKNVLNSLGGLLILNALHKCSQEYLIRRGLLKPKGAGASVELMVSEIKRSAIGYPPNSVAFFSGCNITTSVFSFDLRPDPSTEVS